MRYSRIAALYTAAVAPTLPWLVVLDLRCLWIRPTGNCSDMREIERERTLVRRNKGFTGLAVRGGQLGNLCNVWLLACNVSTVEEMNEFQWTNLQSCSLRARNSLRLSLPGVFTCLTTSLENTIMNFHPPARKLPWNNSLKGWLILPPLLAFCTRSIARLMRPITISSLAC